MSDDYSVLGTDYASHGRLDSQGQIPTVSGKDSLQQSIGRRLKTYLGMYDFIDPLYGSPLKDYVGEFNNPRFHDLICLVIKNCALDDDFISEASVVYNTDKYVFELTVTLDKNVLGVTDTFKLVYPNSELL